MAQGLGTSAAERFHSRWLALGVIATLVGGEACLQHDADETFILKSQKGARGVVGRKPRKRGGKASKPGFSTDEHDCILVIHDRHAATTDALLPDLEGKTFAAVLEPVVAVMA